MFENFIQSDSFIRIANKQLSEQILYIFGYILEVLIRHVVAAENGILEDLFGYVIVNREFAANP